IGDRLRDELADLIASHRHQRAVPIIFVELRTKEQHVDARVEILDRQKELRPPGSQAPHDPPLLRRPGDAKAFPRRADDRVGLQQDDPIAASRVVAMQGQQVTTLLTRKDRHVALLMSRSPLATCYDVMACKTKIRPNRRTMLTLSARAAYTPSAP